jgi:hypothetical protein
MKHVHLALIALSAALLGACASHPAKPDAKSHSPSAVKAPPAAKASADSEALVTKESTAATNSNIVGKPLPGGKFAKLKIGMPMKQAEELIGAPDKQWRQPVGDESATYYSGTEHWFVQYAYKNEGVLTFTAGQEKLLIRILVNRAE